MRTGRTTRWSTCVMFALVSGHPLYGQVVGGQTLTGDWVRVSSNNVPIDRMEITIGGTSGRLTLVPPAAAPNWQIGQVLWQGIQANGSVRVLGGDGNYYPGTLAPNGPDEVHLTVHYQSRTAGDVQMWRRVGTDISGDWVRVGPPGTPGDGTRIQVQSVDATVRYLSSTAPRPLRVGSRIWQAIGASGGLQALGSDRKYHQATWSLLAPDRLQVNAPGLAGGAGQIWVRPAAVAATRANLQLPPSNPNAPGSNLTAPSNPPGSSIPGPSTSPPPGACSATSMRYDAVGVSWGLGFSSPTNNPVQEETVGLRPYMISGSFTRALPRQTLTDWEPGILPGFQPGQAFVWEPRTRAWAELHDLTATAFDQENQSRRSGGFRLTDFEAYDTPAGLRYAGVWVENTEGVGWQVVYDLDTPGYSSAKQNLMNSGFRLVDLEGYQTPNGVRWAGVWVQSCDNTTWDEIRAGDRATYQQQVNAFDAQGFQVIDFETYQTSTGQAYAALVEATPPGRAWAVRSDRTLKWFLNYHQEYEDDGLRLIDFESYDTPNGIRYSGVWAENDARHDYPFVADLEQTVEDYRRLHTVPGVSVVAMRGDDVIYRGGFGWADSVAEKRANARTIYRTASVAKVVGANVAARLESRRADLDLTRPTRDYLPGLPVHHTHTLEQLLAKTGCMWHYDEGPEPTPRNYQWRTSPIAQMQDSLLLSNCMPGRNYHYSTHGFTFLAGALEAVVGDHIWKILDDEIFSQFGLSSMSVAGWGGTPAPGGGRVPSYYEAQAYSWDSTTVAPGQRRGLRTISYENSTWKVLGGGLQTDALDLARFGRLTFRNQIADTTRLWTSQTTGGTNWSDGQTAPPVGLAWNLETRNGRMVRGAIVNRNTAEHGGSGAGARSWIGIYRDNDPVVDELVVVVMTNQRYSSNTLGGPAPIDGLGVAIAGTIFAKPPP